MQTGTRGVITNIASIDAVPPGFVGVVTATLSEVAC